MVARFKVSDVRQARAPLPACAARASALTLIGAAREGHGRVDAPRDEARSDGAVLEATSADDDGPLVQLTGETHPLVAAAGLAFAHHYPLALAPDHVWAALCQGLGVHVAQHPEAMRARFVQHEGTLTLTVRRDDFVKGDPRNPWDEVFAAFTDQLREHVGKRHETVVAEFSTTGPRERAVAQLALMDVVQHYFEYRFLSLCGIPEFELLGAREDWALLRQRARMLGETGLRDWARALDPLLAACVDVFDGRVDQDLWRSFFKRDDQSGGPYITGWINALFPYLHDPQRGGFRRNPAALGWADGLASRFGGGPPPNAFPPALREVPFHWEYLGQRLEMGFLGGFLGVRQRADGALTPQLGWAVRERAGA